MAAMLVLRSVEHASSAFQQTRAEMVERRWPQRHRAAYEVDSGNRFGPVGPHVVAHDESAIGPGNQDGAVQTRSINDRRDVIRQSRVLV